MKISILKDDIGYSFYYKNKLIFIFNRYGFLIKKDFDIKSKFDDLVDK